MQHHDTYIQKFKLNGEPIKDGKITFEDYFQNGIENCLLGGSAVVLYKKSGGELEILLQQRSAAMKTSPSKWDFENGGYIDFGEDPIIAMVREAKEEIGIELDPEKLQFGFCRMDKQEFAIFYFYDWTEEQDSFIFNDTEVQAVSWANFKDLQTNNHNYDLKDIIKPGSVTFSLVEDWFKQHGYLDK